MCRKGKGSLKQPVNIFPCGLIKKKNSWISLIAFHPFIVWSRYVFLIEKNFLGDISLQPFLSFTQLVTTTTMTLQAYSTLATGMSSYSVSSSRLMATSSAAGTPASAPSCSAEWQSASGGPGKKVEKNLHFFSLVLLLLFSCVCVCMCIGLLPNFVAKPKEESVS